MKAAALKRQRIQNNHSQNCSIWRRSKVENCEDVVVVVLWWQKDYDKKRCIRAKMLVWSNGWRNWKARWPKIINEQIDENNCLLFRCRCFFECVFVCELMKHFREKGSSGYMAEQSENESNIWNTHAHTHTHTVCVYINMYIFSCAFISPRVPETH